MIAQVVSATQSQRQSMGHQGSVQNAITLTIQGVSFCLIPSDNQTGLDGASSIDSTVNDESNACNSSALLSFTNGQSTTIRLQSFTGTLMICSSEVPNPTSLMNHKLVPTPIPDSQTNTKANVVSARKVEDDPPTPNSYSNGNESPLEQGQQQLSFQRVSDHKRNPLNVGSKKAKKQRRNSSQDTIPTLGQSSQMTQDTPVPSPKRSKTDGSQICQDSDKSSSWDNANDSDDHSHHDYGKKAIEEDDDNEADCQLEAGNPYASICEVGEKGKIVPDKNLPCDRWGHTMTLIDEDRLLVYGGQTFDMNENKIMTLADLHVYDMTKNVWSKPVNCEGMPRCWHSATFLPDRQLLISFGGEAYNPKTKKTITTDQVMVLDTEIMLWYPPSVSGAVPTGRSGHTASMLQNDLLVFGGVKNNKWQKSLAVLDTMLWKWSVPKISGDAPRARSYHTATPIPSSNLLVIFGGNNETECFNSVHVLDASTENWSWFHPTVNGTAPCPRTGHSAVLLEDGKTILIHGGWDPNVDEDDAEINDEEMFFGDSFLLDTETWTWKSGPKPKFAPRQPGIDNGGPKRAGAPAILAPGEEVSHMLLFGGRIPYDRFSNDFQSITVPQRMMGM
mmetsp:Transcript_13578/g.25486  ORF Transcript_13578/g.25486 Transcript_13578/m.25486 type:complete len:617 (-) Transcript_13578:9996-11846(-)|eukprot:CAMPEP_0176504088 /NCGR_PEP_ID=MMETSP0200_2-20121128/15734_1 /TAXON_ID=947934 /ORGANISM="Chaetoceros sp., Strain GSL56" /LENGTH=616 /DNA_ID=CAMNT_0017903471 /DNA_START=116 /DNA_END=1966 /DNA_ORIENTATION=+